MFRFMEFLISQHTSDPIQLLSQGFYLHIKPLERLVLKMSGDMCYKNLHVQGSKKVRTTNNFNSFHSH